MADSLDREQTMSLRSRVLSCAYKLSPFSLQGDARIEQGEKLCDVSCIINFFGRINLLQGVLFSLLEQDMSKGRYEVILVEDRGGTAEGREIAQRFASLLNVRYFPLPENHGLMGYSRNYGLSKASGKYILFLDDDTVILQNDFLSRLVEEFERTAASAIVPHGGASYCELKGKYSFHDPFYPSNRCMAFALNALRDLGGYMGDIVGQEDVEFTVRYLAMKKTFRFSQQLRYFHPPLIVGSLQKPIAVGSSFARLRRKYSLLVWLLLLMNGARYLPLLVNPFNRKWKMQGRFSLGFLIGTCYAVIGRQVKYRDA